MNIGFEQLLAQHNQEFKEAEVFDSWMPPDGEYIVSLVKLDTGTFVKDGVSLPWWRLKGRIENIQDAVLNGKEFSVGYYTSRAFGILKGAVQTLSGKPIDDLAQAHIILAESLGKVIRAKVDTSTSKKDGRKYTNCFIQEVLDTTSAEDGVEVQQAPIETEPSPADVLAVEGRIVSSDQIETGEPPAKVLAVDQGNSSPDEVVAVDPPTVAEGNDSPDVPDGVG